MTKSRVSTLYLSFLIITAIIIPGCVYLTHFHEAMFVKNLDDNQKEMQAQLDKEEELYEKLRADIDNGRLKKLTHKQAIFRLYAEPVLCRQADGQPGIKETCIYRKPAGGLFSEVILLNFDARDRLYSCQVQNPKK